MLSCGYITPGQVLPLLNSLDEGLILQVIFLFFYSSLYMVAFIQNVPGIEWFSSCVDVPLRNYSLTHLAGEAGEVS